MKGCGENYFNGSFASFHYTLGCSKPHNIYASLIILFNSIPFPPTDRNLAADMSPKPTIFLPSIAEINLHNTGTHLCLLEKFFPDAIKVYWKEKNGNTVLESQQGDVIQTNNTYMKFSWLTVTQKSADKEHICIVKHENNKRGTDQEILFPSMNKGM